MARTKVCPLCGFRKFSLLNGDEVSIKSAKSDCEIKCLEPTCGYTCRVENLIDRPKVLALDADGTLLGYTGCSDFGEPVEGIVDELNKLIKRGWKITIWTCRNADEGIRDHLIKHAIPFHWVNENPFGPKDCSPKIYADVYVDDKGVTFNGSAEGLADMVMAFKPWHKKRRA